MAVVDLLQAVVDRRHDPAAILLVTRGPSGGPAGPDRTSYTTSDLIRAVEERAASLRRGGAVAGRVHPLTIQGDGSGVVTLLALWRMGITPGVLNPGLSAAERAQATRVLTSVDPAGAQAVLWTSGTSGRPRGVALSFEALVASAEATRRRLVLSGPGDTWLASLSTAHVGGLALVTRALLLGSRLVAYGRLTAPEISDLVDGEGLPAGGGGAVTHLSLVPTQLLQVLEHRGDRPPPPSLRVVLIGGAHAPPALVGRAVRSRWPVALTYGMTEMTSQIATATPAEVRKKPGSVGRPVDGVEVSIAPDGEILARGRTLALGYLGTEEPLCEDDGWLHTGDLGEVDDEGCLWVTGRRVDRIVSGGVTVDAHEVESALREHPTVVDVCVVGVPDPRWGEVVAVGVVGVEGELDLDELDAWCRGRLSSARRPRRWVRLDALPVNANGKVDRSRVLDAVGGSRGT